MGVAHTRVSLFGTLSGGLDNWSCGFATPPHAYSFAELSDLALTAVTLWVNAMADAALYAEYTELVTVVGARAQSVNDTGHTTLSGEAILATPAAGTSTGNQLPPECSIVISLRTESAGARGRGRMYMPPPRAQLLDLNGQMDPVDQEVFATFAQDFFNTWNADPTTLSASVASNAGGFVSAVTSIRVGQVIDSQRRRRSAISEAYMTREITI